jgi:hypothetical protein
MYGIKGTGVYTVPQPKTSVGTACLSPVKVGSHRTFGTAVICVQNRPYVTRSVTTQYGQLRDLLLDLPSQHGSGFFHGIVSPYRAKKVRIVWISDKTFSKSPASGIAASAAIGSRQYFQNLIYTGVFLNFEFLGDEIQNNSQQPAQ